ncbi:MAG: phosphoglucomutase [Desulfobulbaceae bacterium]|nr:phosphoglucomutase [Desulfobulbaceae bacterium]
MTNSDNSLLNKGTQENGSSEPTDYFTAIKTLVIQRQACVADSDEALGVQRQIDAFYAQVREQIVNNDGQPRQAISFGTSGWRGIIGTDIFIKSVDVVARAIVNMYESVDQDPELQDALGVRSLAEARKKGCVLGFDNRFGNEILAEHIKKVLTGQGFVVHYAGESTTGTLSAAVREIHAAFSINLTPSHNPLQYGGFKFNAADAGPAAQVVTDWITKQANILILHPQPLTAMARPELCFSCDALKTWMSLVRKGKALHGVDYDAIMDRLAEREDVAVVVDCVHGASRVHVHELFNQISTPRLQFLRCNDDPTFGGIAPEPSTANLALIRQELALRPEPLHLGVIMDPDADRIRFTDQHTEISMNQFGAMAYHFLHEVKGKTGMVAKTVATSNFANAIARALHEDIFEPRVGFKEFKPVIAEALVCFEESDGITVIGHTPEKDAYIGLLLALDMILTLNKSLGDYLKELQSQYGFYAPDKDGVTVTQHGDALTATLKGLDRYAVGVKIKVGEEERTIVNVITIDGHKLILDDDSWIMIRPSGTEPKVRFYVEARSIAGKEALFETARNMLRELGLL